MQPRQILFSCVLPAALAFPAFAAPYENLLGKAAGYLVGTRANWFYDESVRVGLFSNAEPFAAERSALWRRIAAKSGSS